MNDDAMETVRIAATGGGKLVGHLFRGAESKTAAICYIHGLGGHRSGEKSVALQNECIERGWPFAAFNFRGHGESSGSMLDLRCSTLLEDLETVRQYLAGLNIARILPVGSSMGGWATSWFAWRNRQIVPACVLLAPAFRFPHGLWDRLSEQEQRRWQQTGRLPMKNEWLDTELSYDLLIEAEHYPLDQLLQDWHTPALIFHGMRDETIPYQNTISAVEKANCDELEVRLIKSGDHRLTEYKTMIVKAACDFLSQWTEG